MKNTVWQHQRALLIHSFGRLMCTGLPQNGDPVIGALTLFWRLLYSAHTLQVSGTPHTVRLRHPVLHPALPMMPRQSIHLLDPMRFDFARIVFWRAVSHRAQHYNVQPVPKARWLAYNHPEIALASPTPPKLRLELKNRL